MVDLEARNGASADTTSAGGLRDRAAAYSTSTWGLGHGTTADTSSAGLFGYSAAADAASTWGLADSAAADSAASGGLVNHFDV
jgi:hypothetical protein